MATHTARTEFKVERQNLARSSSSLAYRGQDGGSPCLLRRQPARTFPPSHRGHFRKISPISPQPLELARDQGTMLPARHQLTNKSLKVSTNLGWIQWNRSGKSKRQLSPTQLGKGWSKLVKCTCSGIIKQDGSGFKLSLSVIVSFLLSVWHFSSIWVTVSSDCAGLKMLSVGS